MKNEYDIISKKTKEISNKKAKSALFTRRFFKTIFLLMLGAIAYGFSYHFSGLYTTNIRLLTLIVCMVLGFIGFFIINYFISLFAKISYNRKQKKPKIESYMYSDELTCIIESKKYDFIYDFNKTLTENLGVIFENSASLVKDISIKCNKDGKYYYLNYTSKDLLFVFGDVIDGLHSKIDGLFKVLNLQDRPLSFVEKCLVDLVEKDRELATEKSTLKNQVPVNKAMLKLKENLLNFGGKVTALIFKNQIEETANDIIKFVGEEAFKVYYQGKKPNKKLKGGNLNG